MTKHIPVFILLLISVFSLGQIGNAQDNYSRIQDSLRNQLVLMKYDSVLIGSMVEEHYLRGLVNKTPNKIQFELPFNLHGLDCGAPDCFTTTLSFAIPARYPIQFPESILVDVHESGCVDKSSWTKLFELKESNDHFINYYSPSLKSNLYFTRDGQLIYYPHNKSISVSWEKLESMYQNNAFEDVNIMPYTSHFMQTTDYGLFIN